MICIASVKQLPFFYSNICPKKFQKPGRSDHLVNVSVSAHTMYFLLQVCASDIQSNFPAVAGVTFRNSTQMVAITHYIYGWCDRRYAYRYTEKHYL